MALLIPVRIIYLFIYESTSDIIINKHGISI